MWIVFGATGATTAAIAAPEGLRSLVEEISGLSVGALMLLVVYALIRGWFRLNREVEEMKTQRDEWKRLWEQERARQHD